MIDILAAAGSASAAPAWTGWVLPLGMLLILWFLILRPQMRQQKQHRERVAGLAKAVLSVRSPRWTSISCMSNLPRA